MTVFLKVFKYRRYDEMLILNDYCSRLQPFQSLRTGLACFETIVILVNVTVSQRSDNIQPIFPGQYES